MIYGGRQKMSTTTKNHSNSVEAVQPARTLHWTQGMTIALGVPVLILPSIGDFAGYIGTFAIAIWMISIFQGFMQNLAYAELASRYPHASGLPGFAQAVFGNKDQEYGFSKFIGGFSAWGYWFAWNPVLAIFSLLIGKYLTGLFPVFSNVNPQIVSVVAGALIFTGLLLVNRMGVTGGATLGYILAALSLIPLFIISLAGILSDQFDAARITDNLIPNVTAFFGGTFGTEGGGEWAFQPYQLFYFFGIMAMAQWSACAWETAAIYAPLYKKPRRDIPKALFGCGIVCIFSYFLVQTACTGTLGLEGIAADPLSPMLSLARSTMGEAGVNITIIMLLAAMVLIIQTGFLGSSSAMAAMADEGNLPKFFGKRNAFNMPTRSMITICLLNLILISLGNPVSILAASAFGYVLANSISLFAYVKASGEARRLEAQKGDFFKAPNGWKYVALFFGIMNLPFYGIGVTMLNFEFYGWHQATAGFIIILLFVPLWLYSRHQHTGK